MMNVKVKNYNKSFRITEGDNNLFEHLITRPRQSGCVNPYYLLGMYTERKKKRIFTSFVICIKDALIM